MEKGFGPSADHQQNDGRYGRVDHYPATHPHTPIASPHAQIEREHAACCLGYLQITPGSTPCNLQALEGF